MVNNTGYYIVAFMFVLLAIIFWSFEPNLSNGIKTYALEEECGQEVSQIFDTVYQGRLVFEPRPSTPAVCVVTIEAWYSMPHLMFYFTNLNVSCNQGLISFEDGRGTGTQVKGLEGPVCGTSSTDMPSAVYTTESQYLRVTFTRLDQMEQTEVLGIVFTAYSMDASCRNDQYQCSNGRCIHEDLKCSDHNPCGDHSDCRHTLSTVTTAGIIAASLVAIGVLAAIVTMVVYHVYCKKKLENQESNSRSVCGNTNNTQGISHPGNAIFEQTPMSIVGGQQPMYPRNWPYADLHGYNSNNNNIRRPVNGGTNFHYWFMADGTRTNANTDVIARSRDGDVTYQNAVTDCSSDFPQPSTSIAGVVSCIKNTSHSSEDANEVIFFEDEVVMENDMEQFENKQPYDTPTTIKSNPVDKRYDWNDDKTRTGGSVNGEYPTEQHKPLDNDEWGDGEEARRYSVTPELTTSIASTLECEGNYSNLRRWGANPGDDEDDEDIDKTFEHFYRDLLPDRYYDNTLALEGSSVTQDTARAESGPSVDGAAHVNHTFSSDL